MVTPIYAALFALLYVYLSIQVIKVRQREKVGIGDGQNEALARAIRVHGNFAEYVPLALLLLFFVETQIQTSLVMHGLCSVLLIGRLLHIYGVREIKENLRYRVTGMLMTFLVLIVCALILLLSPFFS